MSIFGPQNPPAVCYRRRLQAIHDRPRQRRHHICTAPLVYGVRATPYEVLSEFAGNMAGTLALDDILDRMVSVLAEGTGATRVDVWIRV